MAGVRREIRRDLCRCAIATLFAAACSSSDIVVSNETFAAVVTVVDSGAALRSARTFAMPDTVVKRPATATAIDPALARQLLADVRAHLLALGWTEIPVAVDSRPDVLVLLAASTQVQTGMLYGDWFSAWGYLPYWGPTVDPSWAWGAPAGIAYSYQSGTLLVTMIDVRAQDSNAKVIPMLWAAALDGLVNEATTLSRIHTGINQAFDQSPYLRLN
jgi:hypothetical protein